MNLPQHDWPPPYTIRVSKKSKRMSLRITSHQGLEIIIPRRVSQQDALNFLNLKYEWVQKHRHLLTKKPEQLPEAIQLETIHEKWTVKYGQRIFTNLLQSEATQTLLIKSDQAEIQQRLLKKWLREKAKQHLPQMLHDLSQQYQLPYQEVTVRLQHSRWGSCSQDKKISLNCKLLLLPWELTHYVLVHELVHTIWFNHSKEFWQAVAKIIPNHLQLRALLKNIEHQLPNWVY